MVNHSPLQADEDHSGGEGYIKKKETWEYVEGKPACTEQHLP
jgi:hypothetical protein